MQHSKYALTAQRNLRHFFPKIVDKVIRTSNSDIIIYESRVLDGPSPMLWVDLRTNNGRSLLQKVMWNVVSIPVSQDPLDPNLNDTIGIRVSQAMVMDSESEGSGRSARRGFHPKASSEASQLWTLQASGSPEMTPRRLHAR